MIVSGFVVPPQFRFQRLAECGACGATVASVQSLAGRWTPLDKDGSSHMFSCPNWSAFYKDVYFDGETYVAVRPGEPDSDRERLSRQLEAVRSTMADGRWYTLDQLASAAHCTSQSASARVRDLRKARFGSHTVERRYVNRGLYEYRLAD